MVTEGPPVPPLSGELVAAFRRISPSTVGHMTDSGFMKGVRLVVPPTQTLVGRAYTVRIPHMDSSAVHVAVSRLAPGDVLVVDMNGDRDRASVGGIVGYAATRRGAAGIVVDGAVTDITDLRELGIPVYAVGVSALTTRNLGIEGATGVPVSIGGATVLPGDLILGDENGVMTLRGPDLLRLAQTAGAKEDGEAETRRQLDAGALLMDLSGAARHLATGGTVG